MIELAADIAKAAARKPINLALPTSYTPPPVVVADSKQQPNNKSGAQPKAPVPGFFSKITDDSAHRSVSIQLSPGQNELTFLMQLPAAGAAASGSGSGSGSAGSAAASDKQAYRKEQEPSGALPSELLVNGAAYPIVYSRDPPPPLLVLDKITSAAQDIRVASVAGRDTSAAVKELESIVHSVKRSATSSEVSSSLSSHGLWIVGLGCTSL
jgi:hypothetical protein